MSQLELHDADSRSGKIAEQREPRDPAHVPEEFDLLDTHCRNASRRSDDQNRAARSRTIGHELQPL